ncbi:MAG: PaaI family thioesterase [Acidimicrobiales bacterium]
MNASADFRHDVADWVLAMPVAAALGFSFVELGNGFSETRLPWRPQHSHSPGAFQAGPIGSLADFTGASAGITVLPLGALAATVDYTIKFLAEARGDELVGRGRVLRPGTTLTVIAVDIHAVTDGSERLCASAFVTIRAIASSTRPGAG